MLNWLKSLFQKRKSNPSPPDPPAEAARMQSVAEVYRELVMLEAFTGDGVVLGNMDPDTADLVVNYPGNVTKTFTPEQAAARVAELRKEM